MENTIIYEDLAVFGQASNKCKNDSANKMRENIICAIINNKIPKKYYENSNDWKNMKKHLISIIEDVFDEVHSSNMSKLDENGNPIYREDGKILKGPNYRKPDIGKIVYKFWEAENSQIEIPFNEEI